MGEDRARDLCLLAWPAVRDVTFWGPRALPTLSRKVLVAQSCLTLCDPRDCSLTGSCVHGILQARILEWVAIPFFRRSSRHRTQGLNHQGGAFP